MSSRCTILLYVAVVALFATTALLPPDWYARSASGEFEYESITILAPWIRTTLFRVSAAVALGLLVAGLMHRRWPTIRYPTIGLILAIVAFPIAAFYFWAGGWGQWTTYGRVTDDDGRTYVFCDSSFLQGQIMALTELKEESFFYSRYSVFGSTNGDSPRRWASVIRPQGPQGEEPVENYGQLYLTDNRQLVGLRYGNHCYLIHDLATDTFIGFDDILSTSPFVLLSATNELHAADVKETLTTMMKREPGRAGYPHRATLEAGLTHANPRVVEEAKRLLAADGMRKNTPAKGE